MNTTTVPRYRFPRARPGRRTRAPVVHVLVCGSADRGDDGAPLLAASRLRHSLPPDVHMKVVGQLDVDHLLSVPLQDGVVIADAATGLRSGTIVELPLGGLVNRTTRIRPRSSHALEIPEVVAVADMIRGRPLPGRIVAIGARSFGLGKTLSASVRKAIPALSEALLEAIDHVRRDALAAEAG